jgi:hypothetical protein
MAEPKTKLTKASVEKFLNAIKDKKRRDDCFAVMELMKTITKEYPKMWGTSIVGFGTYHYVYASGREGDWPVAAFSPRKQNLTLYLMPGFEKYSELMGKLGKYTTGKSCLYINQLEDVDQGALKKLITRSVQDVKKHYGKKSTKEK